MINFNEVTPLSKWLAIVFFILVLPVLSFYIGTRYEQATSIDIQNVTTSNLNNSPHANQTVVKIDTSTWKTHRNDNWGFEFKYPSDANIETYGGLPTNPVSQDLAIEFPKNNELRISSSRFRLSITNEDEARERSSWGDCKNNFKELENININGVEYYYKDGGFQNRGWREEVFPEYNIFFTTQKTKSGFSNICIMGTMEATWDPIDLSGGNKPDLKEDVHEYEPNFNPEFEKQISIEILKSLKFDY